jgi:hypothetical protein
MVTIISTAGALGRGILSLDLHTMGTLLAVILRDTADTDDFRLIYPTGSG